MRRNQHDTWQRFCDLHRELLAATEIPTAIVHSETKFRELFELGSARMSMSEISLKDLTAVQWEQLEQFALVFFNEFESYAPLDLFRAFKLEAEQRNTGFHGFLKRRS